jgi:hypothetical protein
MNYLKYVKPSAVTFGLVGRSKTIGQISTCHMLKYPNKAGAFWALKHVRNVKVDNYFSCKLLIQSLCEKFDIPFIPDVKRNDCVTIGHKQILVCHKTFVSKEMEKIYEYINF